MCTRIKKLITKNVEENNKESFTMYFRAVGLCKSPLLTLILESVIDIYNGILECSGVDLMSYRADFAQQRSL